MRISSDLHLNRLYEIYYYYKPTLRRIEIKIIDTNTNISLQQFLQQKTAGYIAFIKVYKITVAHSMWKCI